MPPPRSSGLIYVTEFSYHRHAVTWSLTRRVAITFAMADKWVAITGCSGSAASRVTSKMSRLAERSSIATALISPPQANSSLPIPTTLVHGTVHYPDTQHRVWGICVLWPTAPSSPHQWPYHVNTGRQYVQMGEPKLFHRVYLTCSRPHGNTGVAALPRIGLPDSLLRVSKQYREGRYCISTWLLATLS